MISKKHQENGKT
jgi:hypothetical protein